MVKVLLQRNFYDAAGFLHVQDSDGNEIPDGTTLPSDAVPYDPVARALFMQERAAGKKEPVSVQTAVDKAEAARIPDADDSEEEDSEDEEQTDEPVPHPATVGKKK